MRLIPGKKVPVCICCMLLFSSCGELYRPDIVTYYLDEECKVWLYTGNTGEDFLMMDSLGVLEKVIFESDLCIIGKSTSSSGFMGLQNRQVHEFEFCNQSFSSDQGHEFSINLTALEIPGMCELEIIHDNLEVKIDPLNLTIHSVVLWEKVDDHRSQGFPVKDEKVFSTLCYSDSMLIDGNYYYGVIEFVLEDVKDHWNDKTTIEVVIGKGTGLLRYRLNNGDMFERVSPGNKS